MHVPCFPPHLCLRLPFAFCPCLFARPTCAPWPQTPTVSTALSGRPTGISSDKAHTCDMLRERRGGASWRAAWWRLRRGRGRPRHMVPCRPAPYTDTLCCLLRQGCQPPTPATRRATRTTQPTPQRGWPTASKARMDAGLPRPSCLPHAHALLTCLAHCAPSDHIPI